MTEPTRASLTRCPSLAPGVEAFVDSRPKERQSGHPETRVAAARRGQEQPAVY